ncbi:YitT family protein [Devosia sp.]|uniref:YitT family protein n=1 Tax=Devosia sp. TaxID=1871048 RepID=UPI003A93F47C
MTVPDYTNASRHTPLEDVFAILLGTAMLSFGVMLFSAAKVITGSIAGIALLLSYATDFGFGTLFFTINLPFYLLAALRMGWPFTIKTVVAVALVSLFSALFPNWITIGPIAPLFAALTGGAMIGLGMLTLFRHKASVGGVNILALFLQERFGLRAGWFQLGVDAVILLSAFLVVSPERVVYSLLGALVINAIIGMNHKPGRYVGFS